MWLPIFTAAVLQFILRYLLGIVASNWETQWEKTTYSNLMPYFLLQGLVPAGIRLVPHTVLTFIFLEQLKKYFGIRIISWARSVTGHSSATHNTRLYSTLGIYKKMMEERESCTVHYMLVHVFLLLLLYLYLMDRSEMIDYSEQQPLEETNAGINFLYPFGRLMTC